VPPAIKYPVKIIVCGSGRQKRCPIFVPLVENYPRGIRDFGLGRGLRSLSAL